MPGHRRDNVVIHERNHEILIASKQSVELFRVDFEFDTPGLDEGVELFTPQVNDVLLDGWVSVIEGFNGTTPKLDMGTFVNSPSGLYCQPVDIDEEDPVDVFGDGVRVSSGLRRSISSSYITLGAIDGNFKAWQAIFTETNPLKVVVSQNGESGGDPIGGTSGSAIFYLLISSSVTLSISL